MSYYSDYEHAVFVAVLGFLTILSGIALVIGIVPDFLAFLATIVVPYFVFGIVVLRKWFKTKNE